MFRYCGRNTIGTQIADLTDRIRGHGPESEIIFGEKDPSSRTLQVQAVWSPNGRSDATPHFPPARRNQPPYAQETLLLAQSRTRPPPTRDTIHERRDVHALARPCVQQRRGQRHAHADRQPPRPPPRCLNPDIQTPHTPRTGARTLNRNPSALAGSWVSRNGTPVITSCCLAILEES